MIENKTLVDLGNAIQLELNRLGRVARVSTIKLYVNKEHSEKMRALRNNKISTDLLELFRSQPIYFFLFDVEGVKYVGLVRDTMFYNPRVSTALADAFVSDVNAERCLNSDTLNKATKGKRPHKGADKFEEYSKARCALAFLEILGVVRQCVVDDRVSTKVFLSRCENFSALAKFTLEFFCGQTMRQQACDFFHSFGIIFDYRVDHIIVKPKLLKALVACFQMDLMWSFAGICMCMGIISIEKLKAETDAFVERAGLEHVPRMDLEEWTERVLRCRPILCFLPGDGNAWLTNSGWPISRSLADDVAGFFQVYLPTVKKRSVHFSGVLQCIKGHKPEILAGSEHLTNTDICVVLYNKPHTFEFKDGRLYLGIGRNAHYWRLSAIEVPLDIGVGGMPPPGALGPNGCLLGYVVDIGILSAVIKIRAMVVESEQPWDFFAYCHKYATLNTGETVSNFGDIVQIRDIVSLQASLCCRPSVRCPYYLLASQIVNVKERIYSPWNRCTNSRNPSYEIPETPSSNSETFRQFSPVSSECSEKTDEETSTDEEPRVPPMFQFHPLPVKREEPPKRRRLRTRSSQSQTIARLTDQLEQLGHEADLLRDAIPDESTGAIPKRRSNPRKR